MSLDEESLEECAETGHIDHSKWPVIINPIIDRLNHIAHYEFPIPKPYSVVNPILPSQRLARSPQNPDSLDYPSTLVSATPQPLRSLPPVPPFPTSSLPSNIPDSQPAPSSPKLSENIAPQLPPELTQVLNGALQTLRINFSDKPPHTAQRLCELTLQPKKHYRNLPAWLRALDRVVSVSSSSDIFPLDNNPSLTNGVHPADTASLLFSSSTSRNGASSAYRDDLGSDESLGGALLTPIPWLKDTHSPRDASFDTPSPDSTRHSSYLEQEQDAIITDHLSERLDETDPITQEAMDDARAIEEIASEHRADGSIPTRKDNAVTQGELIRIEQEAGIVPVPFEDISLPEGMLPESQGGPSANGPIRDEDHSSPHARGPDIVGTVDMGLVGGQEREVMISSSPPRSTAAGVTAAESMSPTRSAVNVNNAQEVLSGGQHKHSTDSTSPAITQLHDNSDTAAKTEGINDDSINRPTETAPINPEHRDGDGDVVLVDADGATSDTIEEKTAEGSGENIGSNTTAQ